jgi:hypothetical protein
MTRQYLTQGYLQLCKLRAIASFAIAHLEVQLSTINFTLNLDMKRGHQ